MCIINYQLMKQKINADDLDIRQDTSAGRFYVAVKDHEDAHLDYELHSSGQPNVVEFTETYVPESLRPVWELTRRTSG